MFYFLMTKTPVTSFISRTSQKSQRTLVWSCALGESPSEFVHVCTLASLLLSVTIKHSWTVKPLLSNFNAASVNNGVRAYSNFCSLCINIWCFTGGNENLSRVIKVIYLCLVNEHTLFEWIHTHTLHTFWPFNNVGCEITKLNSSIPHKTT